MAESTQVKLAKIEGKIDNLVEKTNGIDTKLEKDFVTQDQLKLIVQEFKPYKTMVLWLLAVVAAETIALLFYLIRALISQQA